MSLFKRRVLRCEVGQVTDMAKPCSIRECCS